MLMCCLKAAQMNGLSFRAAKELVKPLASFLPNGKNILFLATLSSLTNLSTLATAMMRESRALALAPGPRLTRHQCLGIFDVEYGATLNIK